MSPFDLHKPDTGMSLVEMAVALALTGLLTLLISTGLPLLSTSAERVVGASADTRALSMTHALLDRHLRSLIAEEQENARDGELVFEGTATGLRFVSVLPLALQAEGHPVSDSIGFEIRTGAEGSALYYRPGNERFSRLLIATEGPIRFSYFGTQAGTEGWFPAWADQTRLPRLVKLETPGWPVMMFRIPLSSDRYLS